MKRALKIMNTACAVLAGAAVAAIVVLVALQIAMRTFVGRSFPWTSEVSVYALLWAVALGIVLAFADSSHIALDIVSRKLPPGARRVLELAVGAFTIVFLLVLLVTSFEVTAEASDQLSPVLRLPMAFVYAAFPVACVLSIVNVAAVLADRRPLATAEEDF